MLLQLCGDAGMRIYLFLYKVENNDAGEIGIGVRMSMRMDYVK